MVYGLAMVCVALPVAGVSLWRGELGREAEARGQALALARQASLRLAPAFEALTALAAVRPDAPACVRANVAWAAVGARLPGVSGVWLAEGGRSCALGAAREEPIPASGWSLASAGLRWRGSVGDVALAFAPDWLGIAKAQARAAGVELDFAAGDAGGRGVRVPVAGLPPGLSVSARADGWGAGWADAESGLLSLGLGAALASWLRRGAGSRRASEWEILEGMRNQEFSLLYQPIVTASGGACVGAELLARWRHPAQGGIRADLFIRAAIEAGLIAELTRYLLARAAEELRQIVLPPGFMVAFNLASESLAMPELLEDCRELLAVLREKQATLVLDVSERAPLLEDAGTLEVISALRRQGVKLALDDFGSGYADQAYLQRWGFDFLKVDRGFVSTLGRDCLRGNALEEVLLRPERMGARIIVKGVETQGQQSYLSVKGFELLQGFYFGKPMTLNHFRQWLYSGIVEDRKSSLGRETAGGRRG
ncbi:EAL domain-containing protein [Chromobacterium alticapitis]|uniref:EAL domain-containing protein n=1 Tax=Chromobacterium alticapitis TaxID=2073169 RepID=A0A2S5DCM0_9NEIS|nr:EAL domain-containing protein [Chromobacterium alticapitis]POZ60835.1 hypothetical protein C2I19_16950 [Chromobacterium alticapitis]